MPKPQKPTSVRLGSLEVAVRKLASQKDWSNHKAMLFLIAEGAKKNKLKIA